MPNPLPFDLARFPRVDSLKLARQWLLFRNKLLAAPTSLHAYAADIEDFLSWCGEHGTEPYSITVESVADYIEEMQAREKRRGQRRRLGSRKGLTPTTIYRRAVVLRAWFDYLVDHEVVAKNPFTHTRYRKGDRVDQLIVPQPKPRIWIPNDRDWHKILSVVAEQPLRDRLMFLLAYECALRREELCTLALEDIDHSQRLILIRASKSKSRFDRRLPISNETDRILARYEAELPLSISSAEPIFRSLSDRNYGKPITLWTWNKVIERIRDKAAVVEFHSHTIRHVALTDLARAGWDILTLKDFAGHRDPRTTQHYISLGAHDLAIALDRTLNSLFGARCEQLHGALR